MSNYIPPDQDNYAPLSHDQAQALSDALDQYQLQQRPWWQRITDCPCFVAIVLGQVVRRRWAELRGGRQ